MGSDAVKMRVVGRLGVARLAPSEARAYAAGTPEARELILAKLADGIGRSLKIDTAPGLPIVRLTYQSTDPQLAAAGAQHPAGRIPRLPPHGAADAHRRRARRPAPRVRGRASTRRTRPTRTSSRPTRSATSTPTRPRCRSSPPQIEQQQLTNDAALKEKAGRLAAIDAELAGLPPEVGLYHDADPTAQTKLADLKVQREQLLSRYQPDAQPVKDMDAQIAQLEAGIARRPHAEQGRGAQRRQSGLPDLPDREAAAGRRGRRPAPDRRDAGRRDEPAHRAAPAPGQAGAAVPGTQPRPRRACRPTSRTSPPRPRRARPPHGIAAATNDNIRIVQRAAPPTQGKSLRKPGAGAGA